MDVDSTDLNKYSSRDGSKVSFKDIFSPITIADGALQVSILFNRIEALLVQDIGVLLKDARLAYGNVFVVDLVTRMLRPFFARWHPEHGAGRLMLLRLLIAHNANVNVPVEPRTLYTPLMVVTSLHELPSVRNGFIQLLLEAKADTTMRSKFGRTALQMENANVHSQGFLIVEHASRIRYIVFSIFVSSGIFLEPLARQVSIFVA